MADIEYLAARQRLGVYVEGVHDSLDMFEVALRRDDYELVGAVVGLYARLGEIFFEGVVLYGREPSLGVVGAHVF